MPSKTNSNEVDGGKDAKLNRRSVLSKTAVGAGALVGVSRSAGATDADGAALQDHHRMVARFDDRAAVARTFEEHTDELVAELAEAGLASDKSTLVKAAKTDDVRVGVVEEDGRPITHLQTTLDVGDGTLTAVVHAETGRSYAVYRPTNEDRVLRIDPDVAGRPGTQSCWTTDSECRYASCDGWENAFVSGSEYEKTCCGGVCQWENTGNCCDPA